MEGSNSGDTGQGCHWCRRGRLGGCSALTSAKRHHDQHLDRNVPSTTRRHLDAAYAFKTHSLLFSAYDLTRPLFGFPATTHSRTPLSCSQRRTSTNRTGAYPRASAHEDADFHELTDICPIGYTTPFRDSAQIWFSSYKLGEVSTLPSWPAT